MKKRLFWLILALLIVAGLVVALVSWSYSAPQVPHSLEQRADCTGCHALNGVKPYPNWHVKRELGNDACLGCHKLALEISR